MQIKNANQRGAWVAQSVGRPTSAQVMISRSVSSSPASGSVLTAQSLEPALDSVCVSLSLLLPCSHSVSPSLSFLFFLIFFNVYLFLRQRETEHEQGRSRERGRHRIQSRLQALSCKHRARCGAQTQNHEITTTSKVGCSTD